MIQLQYPSLQPVTCMPRGSTFLDRLDKVWSSPYLRATQTAAPTAARYSLMVHELPLHEFTYLCPARCAGTATADRAQWLEEYWQRCEPHYIDGPGAEAFSSLVQRARSAISHFKTKVSASHSVAFSHGQFLQMIYWLSLYEGEPISNAGMRAYRAFDLKSPIHHCEGFSLEWRSPRAGGIVKPWRPA